MVLSPVVLGTKNHCAGENQRQFSSQSANDLVLKLRRNKRSAYTEKPTPPLFEEEAPLLSTYMSRREQKSWS
jgi:hypothetical protein